MTGRKNSKPFSKLIASHREECTITDKDGKRRKMKTRDISDALHIDYETTRKIINMQRPTKKRDYIIAICALVKMDSDETNEALELYNNMPKLDGRKKRDCELKSILDSLEKDPLDIDEINRRLCRNGVPMLDIVATNCQVDVPFMVVKKGVDVLPDSLLGDIYDSIATRYGIEQYNCKAWMALYEEKTEKKYILYANTTKKGVYAGEKTFCVEPFPTSEENKSEIRSYDNINETGIFKDYFLELSSMVTAKHRELMLIANDTRNYGERIGAGIQNDLIHLYMEVYNYDFPERKEYYMMEYVDGVFRLSISHSSRFMQCYLPKQEYEANYKKPFTTSFEHYDSVEEIEQHLLDKNCSVEDRCIHSSQRKAYGFMKEKIQNCLQRLRERKIFVRNLTEIWGDERDGLEGRVCRYYGVEKQFECTETKEGFVFAGTKHARVKGVELTLDELNRAFELGFDQIDEICCVKVKYGNIESVLA